MLSVGIIGKNGKNIANILGTMAGAHHCYHATPQQPLTQDTDIIIITDYGSYQALSPDITHASYMIINSDDKEIFSILSTSNSATVITYGLNSRACITTSSMAEGKLQVCIQRSFIDIQGAECVPQEFSIPLAPGIDNVIETLAAGAAMSVCGLI